MHENITVIVAMLLQGKGAVKEKEVKAAFDTAMLIVKEAFTRREALEEIVRTQEKLREDAEKARFAAAIDRATKMQAPAPVGSGG
ncbi:MAG: hypothetical protein WAV09_03495 [Minisyncoccia bacterium]